MFTINLIDSSIYNLQRNIKLSEGLNFVNLTYYFYHSRKYILDGKMATFIYIIHILN